MDKCLPSEIQDHVNATLPLRFADCEWRQVKNLNFIWNEKLYVTFESINYKYLPIRIQVKRPREWRGKQKWAEKTSSVAAFFIHQIVM